MVRVYLVFFINFEINKKINKNGNFVNNSKT